MNYQIKIEQAHLCKSDCVVVGVNKESKLSNSAKSIDKASKGYLSKILKQGDISGKQGQTLMLYNVPGIKANRVLLVGCGAKENQNEMSYRKTIQAIHGKLTDSGAKEACLFIDSFTANGRKPNWLCHDAIIQFEQASYKFTELKSKTNSEKTALKQLNLVVGTQAQKKSAVTAVEQAHATSLGMTLTKNLGNLPANICTPAYLAKQAKVLVKDNPKFSCKILEEADMQRLKMGALLSVTAGSKTPAKLIQIEYKGGKKSAKPIVLVGKGITFDTGGNSLKPSSSMIGMKYDMCGGATVFGVLKAISKLNLPLNVVGLIPACENMPGPTATRPDDVITSMSGQTIEVLNTDAEGRLILADTLTYAERFKPDCVIDMATLTGACIVALGHETSALMGNHPPLTRELIQASEISFDRTWELPIWDNYAEPLKSNFADMANIASSGPPSAGTIVAGCFLAKFAKEYHWAHLDIAGVACHFSGSGKGASGRPVPMLVQFLVNRCKKS